MNVVYRNVPRVGMSALIQDMDIVLVSKYMAVHVQPIVIAKEIQFVFQSVMLDVLQNVHQIVIVKI